MRVLLIAWYISGCATEMKIQNVKLKCVRERKNRQTKEMGKRDNNDEEAAAAAAVKERRMGWNKNNSIEFSHPF